GVSKFAAHTCASVVPFDAAFRPAADEREALPVYPLRRPLLALSRCEGGSFAAAQIEHFDLRGAAAESDAGDVRDVLKLCAVEGQPPAVAGPHRTSRIQEITCNRVEVTAIRSHEVDAYGLARKEIVDRQSRLGSVAVGGESNPAAIR